MIAFRISVIIPNTDGVRAARSSSDEAVGTASALEAPAHPRKRLSEIKRQRPDSPQDTCSARRGMKQVARLSRGHPSIELLQLGGSRPGLVESLVHRAQHTLLGGRERARAKRRGDVAYRERFAPLVEEPRSSEATLLGSVKARQDVLSDGERPNGLRVPAAELAEPSPDVGGVDAGDVRSPIVGLERPSAARYGQHVTEVVRAPRLLSR